MSAVTPVLLKTIKQLQSLPSLSRFALAGGTNLAIRYNHRKSQDIDLFCSEIVGVKHFLKIEQEVKQYFGEQNITGLEYPVDKVNDQYTYLRFWVTTQNESIKVEIIQNMKKMDEFEVINDVRLLSIKDIGLFKLVSGSSRAAKKDIYDLAFITQTYSLIDLFESLKQKKQIFNKLEDKNIFDLDEEEACPIQNPHLLLKFDTSNTKVNVQKPMHSNDVILIEEGSDNWYTARSKWRMSVRKLFNYLGVN